MRYCVVWSLPEDNATTERERIVPSRRRYLTFPSGRRYLTSFSGDDPDYFSIFTSLKHFDQKTTLHAHLCFRHPGGLYWLISYYGGGGIPAAVLTASRWLTLGLLVYLAIQRKSLTTWIVVSMFLAAKLATLFHRLPSNSMCSAAFFCG